MQTHFVSIFLLILWSQTIVSNGYGSNPFVDISGKRHTMRRLEECFCELSGPVDVCCCDVETVDMLNANNIYPLISNLVNQTYFRFFKINLQRHCPFWAENAHCVLKGCHVEECDQESVPSFLKDENNSPCIGDIELKLSSINKDISSQQAQEFLQWKEYDDAQENYCYLEDENSKEAIYVDLVLNPERYTGYSGDSPHKIWSAIYNENCFKSKSSKLQLEAPSIKDLCLEKRAFFRLISGLHSSINIHLSAKYIKSGALSDHPTFGPHLDEFVKRFDSSTTNGQGPGWLKNLYFTYLVVLRAITKAEVLLSEQQFYTGVSDDDTKVKDIIQKLVNVTKSCGHRLFDESQLFTEETYELKEEFRSHFLNISRIMDCVGCTKCRLWGTLQIQGIGTALKILFSNQSHIHIRRQEIVALFNVLGRLSSSIHSLKEFRDIQVHKN